MRRVSESLLLTGGQITPRRPRREAPASTRNKAEGAGRGGGMGKKLYCGFSGRNRYSGVGSFRTGKFE